MSNTITSATSATTSWADPTNTAALPTQTLTQQDFLNLLVAQMTAQDPMNPESNTDFAAQMAQFTALSTSQATQADMQLDEANNLLDRTVTLQGANNTSITGTVTGVQMVDGAPQLVVNGSSYDLSKLLAISPANTTNP